MRLRDGKVVVVEGHVLLCSVALMDLATHAFYLEATPETCRTRRVGRKIRSAEERSILERYFDTFVIPAHVNEVLPLTHRYAGKLSIVDNSEHVAVEDVVK